MIIPRASGNEPRRIAEGDVVIVYERFDSMKSMVVDAKAQYNTKFGVFDVKTWIGTPYGSRVSSRSGKGWVYVLAGTPELWTQVLRHRTQILYVADMALVVSQLRLRPGSVVLESGTGSGSLTTTLARAVAPHGHIFTFEFHAERAEAARQDFASTGVDGVAEVAQRDIEGLGFPESLHGRADAVFLDLPGPHKVVPSAQQCLRPNGRLCAFSPCLEQVEATSRALWSNGFHSVRVVEILLREYEVTRDAQESTYGRAAEKKREKEVGATEHAELKMEAEAKEDTSACMEDPEGAQKRALEIPVEPSSPEEPGRPAKLARSDLSAVPVQPAAPAGLEPPARRVLARPVAAGRGHTGYLLFAVKGVPVSVSGNR